MFGWIMQEGPNEECRRDANRHVDEKAPSPAVVIRDPSAERGAERRRDDDTDHEDRLDHGLLFLGEDLPQRRLSGGEKGGPAGALNQAIDDELPERRRRPAREGRDDEQDD